MSEIFYPTGKHILMEFWNVDPKILDDEPFLTNLLCESVKASGAHILGVQSHKFDLGASATLLLSESHAAYHTYPQIPYEDENGNITYKSYMSSCIYTCGETIDPVVSYKMMKNVLNAEKSYFKIIDRGYEDGLRLN